MKNTLKVPTGPAISAIRSATEAKLVSNGALAAIRCAEQLLSPEPVPGKTLKAKANFAKHLQAHHSENIGAGTLLTRLSERDNDLRDVEVVAALARAFNAQRETEQRDEYVRNVVLMAKLEYLAPVTNMAVFDGNIRDFKAGFAPCAANPVNASAPAEMVIWKSAQRAQLRYRQAQWKVIADEAMTDLLAPAEGLVVMGQPTTYGNLLGMRAQRALAGRFQRMLSAATGRQVAMLEAGIRVSSGEGTVEDIQVLSTPNRNNGTADVIGLICPGLSLPAAHALLVQGKVSLSDEARPEVRARLLSMLLPYVNAMALTFGRANAHRFNHRIESAVAAFDAEGIKATQSWRPWLPGAQRSLAEIIVSQGSAGALKHTMVEWSQASGALQGTELRRYQLVIETRKEIISKIGYTDSEMILGTLNKRGELADGGKDFTLEEVELWIQLEAERYTASFDANLGDADNSYTLADIVASPVDYDLVADALDREMALASFGEERELLEEMETRENADYLSSLSDEDALEYLMLVRNSRNVQVMRAVLANIRKADAEEQAKRHELLASNGMLRPDGTSVFKVQQMSREEVAEWVAVMHTPGRPRTRPVVGKRELIGRYEQRNAPLDVIRQVLHIVGDARDEQMLLRDRAARLLHTFFTERLEARTLAAKQLSEATGTRTVQSRLITARDFSEALGMLRKEGLDVSANLVQQIADFVVNTAFKRDAALRRTKRLEDAAAAHRLIRPGDAIATAPKPAAAQAAGETQVEDLDLDALFSDRPSGEVEDFDLEAEFGENAA